mgnify:CR=1 FL=1
MDLVDIVSDLREEVPDCPAEFCENRFVRAATDFLARTRVWRESAELIGAAATNEYRPLLSSSQKPAEVLTVSYNGSSLKKASRGQLARKSPSQGKPETFAAEQGNITVYPDPGEDVSENMEALLVLSVSRTMTSIPDEVYDQYGEVIRSGALGRLMTMPNRPWSAYEVGRMHLSYYSEEVERWQAKAPDDGNVGVARRVRYGGY